MSIPLYPVYRLDIQNSETRKWFIRVEMFWYFQPAVERAKTIWRETEHHARVVNHTTGETLFSTEDL